MHECIRGYEKPLSPYEVVDSGKELLEHFGVNSNPIENPQEYLELIKQVDPRFQGERSLSRQDLELDVTEWPKDTIALINKTAEAMRMVAFDEKGQPIITETPLIGHYDLVIALGGARYSNLDRARYAIDCAKDRRSDVSFNQLVIAGSGRLIPDNELKNPVDYASADAKTQFDLCVGAAKTVAQENPGSIVGVSYISKEKAGTPDVINSVLEAMVQNETVIYGETSVAAVTTQIYQVSTYMDLERVGMKFGITNIYVAGNPSAFEMISKRTAATYLSEILRTLKAATMLIMAEAA